MIEALMNGRIPRANTPRVEIPPPVKMSRKPSSDPPCSIKLAKAVRSIPGIGM
jgi:hypothetical protein